MNRQLTAAELASLERPQMTRRDKLMRLAEIVRRGRSFFIFNGLEHWSRDVLDRTENTSSAFAAAAADPILREAGLQSGIVGEAMRFFELSRGDLHYFSCDCGGHIGNEEMARRIEYISQR